MYFAHDPHGNGAARGAPDDDHSDVSASSSEEETTMFNTMQTYCERIVNEINAGDKNKIQDAYVEGIFIQK